ncbi:hypothetical protein J25TS5_00380 [Paenibacillus faecis]|uniref:prenylated flavin chaperone LpdD n=1 Tax=Paenibacillus faecis TaxID=862114 RepID=UPI001B111C31|nr:hypothetical protein [Paenibacillus faecis]GIO83106.1 hypothetical protein J25TS5_00380 [Paenibacillus faecis]
MNHKFADIRLESVPMGRDLLIMITGGEAHIGAASTAYPAAGGAEVQTSAVPGHKEHVLTESLAKRAAAELSRTVTLVMGIHYDGLTREEIGRITQRTEELMDEFISSARHLKEGGINPCQH